jgi:hypothetical protein
MRRSNTPFRQAWYVRVMSPLIIALLVSTGLYAQCELDDCCGTKPRLLTMLYNGESCDDSDNCQTLDTCEDFIGGPNGDSQVYIEASGNHGTYGPYTVNIGDLFTMSDPSQLSPKIDIFIYDEEGGQLLQQIQFHASCSEPIVAGDQFGSLILTHYIGKNNGGECMYQETPAPVNFGEIEGWLAGKNVLISWTTLSEVNNDGFEVQRSITGDKFTTIGFVKGLGTSTRIKEYDFIDYYPINGNIIYRLKQIDFDGTVSFSKNVIVRVNEEDRFGIIPNPLNNKQGQIQIFSTSGGLSTISFYSINNLLVFKAEMELIPGINTIHKDISHLLPGTYIVKFQQGFKNHYSRVIVQ